MFTLDLDDLRNVIVRARGAAPLSIEPMPGGASTRKFFRVGLAGGGSGVAMFVPDLTHSDEIDKSGKPRRWPYLEVRDVLEERGVRVPSLIADGTDVGWTVVEDLGDDTVAEYLLRRPQHKKLVYQTAVRDLARAQRALDEMPADCIVRKRAFDYDLLRWEIDHFREWALDALDRSLSTAARAVFDRIGDRLAQRVAELPRGFVHRDYQSRNLMVIEGSDDAVGIGWVDFQDALMGPMVYDLVALLNDSYQQFDRQFVEERIEEFGRERGLDEQARSGLVRQFDLVTVQRKLKDAGRFVFIDRVKKDSSYLKFVEPTLQKVRMSIERLSDDADMRELREVLGYVLER